MIKDLFSWKLIVSILKKIFKFIIYAFLLLFGIFLELFGITYSYLKYGEYFGTALGLCVLAYDYFLYTNFKVLSKKSKRLSMDNEIFSYIPAIFIISPLVVNAVLLWIFFDPTLIDLRKFIVGDARDWLAFFGAIIGGSITMIAVAYTIRNENEQRKDELALQTIPFLVIEFSGKNPKDFFVAGVVNGENQLVDITGDLVVLPLVIKNTSQYIAKDVYFESVLILHETPMVGLFSKREFIEYANITDECNKKLDGAKTIPGSFSEDIELPLSGLSNLNQSIALKIELSFFDAGGYKKHFIESDLQISYEIQEVGEKDDKLKVAILQSTRLDAKSHFIS